MLRKLIIALTVLIIGLSFVFLPGCQTKSQTGALVGGLGGAGVGAAIGGTKGAVIGGALGAGGGYLVGREMQKKDQQRAAEGQNPDTVVVDVPNSNGSVTPVTLHRSGNVWVGPKGEEYSTIPTPEELKPIYGM